MQPVTHRPVASRAISSRECLYRLDGMLLQARRGYYKRGLESNSKHNEAIQTRPGCRSFSFGICPHCSRFQCERARPSRELITLARAYIRIRPAFYSRILIARDENPFSSRTCPLDPTRRKLNFHIGHRRISVTYWVYTRLNSNTRRDILRKQHTK